MVFKRLFSNEKGVTPVVGVMLMVVVTVILAAAVSSYAASMKTQELAPQATLKASANFLDGYVKLEHLGGDALEKGKMVIEIATGTPTTSGYVNMSNVTLAPSKTYLRPGDMATISFDNTGGGAKFTGDEIDLAVFKFNPFKVTIIDKDTGQTVYSTTVVMNP